MGFAQNWHYDARKAEMDAAELARLAELEALAAAEAARLAAEREAEMARLEIFYGEMVTEAIAMVEEETFLVEVFDLLVYRAAEEILAQKVKDFAAANIAKREKEAARKKDEADRAAARDALKKEREKKTKDRDKKEKAEMAAQKAEAELKKKGAGVPGMYDNRDLTKEVSSGLRAHST